MPPSSERTRALRVVVGGQRNLRDRGREDREATLRGSSRGRRTTPRSRKPAIFSWCWRTRRGSASSWMERARQDSRPCISKVSDKPTWSAPAVSGNRLFVKDETSSRAVHVGLDVGRSLDPPQLPALKSRPTRTPSPRSRFETPQYWSRRGSPEAGDSPGSRLSRVITLVPAGSSS